ncbi:MAG: ATP-binding protein [Actinobacteria bacterium]|nr:ATP-binding protein [Actinomycetota bacterium]
MKQVVVLSGKGGTGKTTVAAALVEQAGRAMIADCDVEAPNLHLLLKPRTSRSYTMSVSRRASIDPGLCTRCGSCEGACRFGAIREFRVEKHACEGCGLCERLCPAGAVSMQAQEGGEVFVGETPYGKMVWARLAVGEEASGKMVSQVRMEAQALAVEEGYELLLVDGSPGIGCPVIASVTGADLALMVAEPTLSGRHDLARALETASFFRIPSLVCINKCDINEVETERIRADCFSRGVEVAAEIPYLEGLAEAARLCVTPLEALNGEASLPLRRLFRKVMEGIGLPAPQAGTWH